MKKYLFALLLMLAGNVSLAQAVVPKPTFPDNTALDQWWPFCNATDLLDRTFNGFDLLSSNVDTMTDRFGVPSRAYRFNGFNSELHYTSTLAMPLAGIADFTYACRVYASAAQYSVILYNGNPNVDGIGLIMTNAAGTGAGNRIGIRFGGTGTTFVPPGSAITLNTWHHLVLTRNGNSYLLYIDGVFVSPAFIPTVFPPSGIITPTTVFQLGLDMTAGDKAFLGGIDDVVTYSRQLTATDIRKLIEFDPNISFNIGPDTAICPNAVQIGGARDTMMLDTVRYPNSHYYPSIGFDYTWSDGDTVSTVKNITFLSVPQPPVIRTLTLGRKYSCPASSTKSITHIIPTINLGPDTALCMGDTVILNYGADTSGMVSYTWNDGSRFATRVTDTTGYHVVVKDSSFTFVNPMTSTVDTVHCVATDNIRVDFSPEIFVHVTEKDTSCNGAPVILYSFDDTAYFSPTYKWEDGIGPAVTTPSLTVTSTGIYTLTVTDGACVKKATSTVIIVNVSTSVLSNDTAICKGASIVANATGTPGILYQWTPTAGMATSNIPTPTITPDTSAWYVLTATIIEPRWGGLLNCKAQDSFFVDVQPVPIVKMGGNKVVCQYDSIRIAPTIIPNWYTHYIYDWTPGTYLDDSTAPNVVFTAGDTTKLILVVTTPAGCKSSDSGIIFTFNGDFLSMSRDTSICPGDSVVIMPVSSEPGVTTITWSPSTYVNYPIATTPVTIKPENDISYSVIGTSMYGCTDTLTYSIKVLPAAVINMVDSVTLFPGETSYEIEPLTNGTSYSWFPPVGLSDTAVSNPVATPYVNTKYILTSRTQDGCSTKDSIYINLSETSIINVPNAFVPGSNYNGSIMAIIKGTARLRYFRIFDRWGKLVFEGKDINIGWDGMVGGTPAPFGVYVYEAEAITERGRILHKQGNITLLK